MMPDAATVRWVPGAIPDARLLAGPVLILALAACDFEPPPPAGPLPPEKRDFVGVWEQRVGNPGDKTYQYVIARIFADGRMSYKKLTISGAAHYCTFYQESGIQKMTASGIEAETIFGLDLHFSVEQPPRESNGEWTMTLDGDRLARTRPEPEPNVDEPNCDEVKID